VAQLKNKKRRQKMNGLIKQTKLDGVNTLGSFAIALFSIVAAVYVMVGGAIA
jgi:hypothetical protein